ncbi:DUF1206 domain-containing protein [Amnibacterium sp.]|uniref:DUF1206 domain-containing protein n=1 Tax=Amnibacterium sp. TaxID=1872496 RepID=UPI0026193DE2|nr:DUF1206 domain-containing protein [Amnibacterium sp.]MCU1474373.1 hypothetical protein [Amnibacterium sp.]
MQGVARAGFVASGLVQVLIGVVAIEVALHRSDSQPDQTGALHDVAGAPGGPVVLWAAPVASLALGLWLVVAGVIARNPDRKRRWSGRIREWGRALVYLVVGVEALRVALGADASSARTSRTGSKDLLSVPGGAVVLALLGAAVVVAGGVVVWLGITKRFTRVVRVPRGRRGAAFVLLGRVGYIARGVAVAVVGILFVVAAFTLDPAKAAGLDGALKSFAALPSGEVVLVVLGLGWIAAGLFSVWRAKQAVLDD